jgi:hypothetical protein
MNFELSFSGTVYTLSVDTSNGTLVLQFPTLEASSAFLLALSVAVEVK